MKAISMAKQKTNETLKEATGYTAAGIKLAIVVGPILLGVSLGLPEINADQAVAMLSVATGIFIGFKFLHDK